MNKTCRSSFSDQAMSFFSASTMSHAFVSRGLFRCTTLLPSSIHLAMRFFLRENDLKCHAIIEFLENARRHVSRLPLQTGRPSMARPIVRFSSLHKETHRG